MPLHLRLAARRRRDVAPAEAAATTPAASFASGFHRCTGSCAAAFCSEARGRSPPDGPPGRGPTSPPARDSDTSPPPPPRTRRGPTRSRSDTTPGSAASEESTRRSGVKVNSSPFRSTERDVPKKTFFTSCMEIVEPPRCRPLRRFSFMAISICSQSNPLCL